MLFKEVCDHDLGHEARNSLFAKLLQTPGGPFDDPVLPMDESVRRLARHVTAEELRSRHLSPNFLDPRDVENEALIVFMNRCHTIRDLTKLRAWFWSTMQIRIKKALVQSRPYIAVSEVEAVDKRTVPPPAHPIEERRPVSLHPKFTALRDALRGLSPKLREVTVLHAIRGLSCEEIARELKLKPSTVRVRWLRAKRALCQQLEGAVSLSA